MTASKGGALGGSFPLKLRVGVSGFVLGRTSFFFLPEAGRISSRLTGTPSETRNNRRMRDRFQSGGLSGTGEASWFHNDIARSLFSGSVFGSIAMGSIGSEGFTDSKYWYNSR